MRTADYNRVYNREHNREHISAGDSNRTSLLRRVKLLILAILGLLCFSLSPTPTHADLGTDIIFVGIEEVDTHSVAWGDWDGDGDLDLAAGKRVYENKGDVFSLVWDGGEGALSVAWGDWDWDGDLDLAAGKQVYENQEGSFSLAWDGGEGGNSVAWGDWDGDGDLDLAVGNEGVNQVYENDASDGWQLKCDPPGGWGWESTGDERPTRSVAWGDWDNDGDLDLAVGNGKLGAGADQANQVYENDGGTLQLDPDYGLGWESNSWNPTDSVAWGDVDGDGYLDLAIANGGRENSPDAGGVIVYMNVGGTLSHVAWAGSAKASSSVAWGDWDGDGDLDLAVGNVPTKWTGGENDIYENDGGVLSLAWESLDDESGTWSVAWGDWDGDGDLDLAAGNGDAYYASPFQNLVYLNDRGSPLFSLAWFSDTNASAWGDWDGDGDLDLAAGRQVYENHGGSFSLAWEDPGDASSVAWGDWDSDGDLDLAVGDSSGTNLVYENQGGSLSFGWASIDSDSTRSVAWGDWDGDGDLDLAAGNYGVNRVYENDATDDWQLKCDPAHGWGWVSPDEEDTNSVAWGDYDGDGDLDLAVGNGKYLYHGPNQVYRNEGGTLSLAWESTGDERYTRSVAWGDYDGDGDLDLAVGNAESGFYGTVGGVNQVYENDGGTLKLDPANDLGWVSLNNRDFTTSVAWGDYDGDGDLDLAVGNSTRCYQCTPEDQVYRNDQGNLHLAWEDGAQDTDSIAWGDWDGDGDLDLASNAYVYRNLWLDNAPLVNNPPSAYAHRPGDTHDAFFYSMSRRPETSTLPLSYTLFDAESDPVSQVKGYYSINGGGVWLPAATTTGISITRLATSPWPTPTIANTHVYTWDTFASGFFGQSDNVVFRLDVTGMTGPFQRAKTTVYSPPFRVRGTQVRVFSETVHVSNTVENALVYRLPQGQAGGALPLADSSGTPFRTDQHGYLQGRGEIGLDDGLFAMLPVSSHLAYAGALEFDGQDDYMLVAPLHDAPTTGTTVSFWMRSEDTAGDGTPLSYAVSPTDATFLMTDYNNFTLHRGAGVSVTTGISATDGLWHHIAVAWRSADGQVKLYKDGVAAFTGTLTTTHMISGGNLVLGRDQGGEGFFQGFLDQVCVWNTVLTETQVWANVLRPPRGNEPHLVAYWSFDDPLDDVALDHTSHGNDGTLVGATWAGDPLGSYTVYHTSAAPTETGLDLFTVSQPGTQVLTVTAQHPLVLFDLVVSLEWDARNDALFLSQLTFDLQRASEFLYDWTNGQAALGQVQIYHDRQRWNTADIRVYATNRLRPFATLGGITHDAVSDPVSVTEPIVYTPGQIRMGAVWNRFGDANGTLGEDWPRALAHELGHYVFYLHDNYLGLDDEGLVVPLDTCSGTAMSDPYRDDYSEFHHGDGWQEDCAETLSAQMTGRWDWQTITTFYPWLDGLVTNPGPSGLPLAVTQIQVVEPPDPTTVLDVPIFYLTYEGGRVQPGASAQAFLFQGERLIDLGGPTFDKVRAHGARPGDEVCVYELSAGRLGCETVRTGDSHMELVAMPGWQPDVLVSPVNSRTIAISVTLSSNRAPALTLQARLYPASASAPATVPLTLTQGVYRGTVYPGYPVIEGYVRVWVHEDRPRREIVTGYALGGNPVPGDMAGFVPGDMAGFVPGDMAGFVPGDMAGFVPGDMAGFVPGDMAGFVPGDMAGFVPGDMAGFAPGVSPDGQVLLFGDTDFEPGEFYALQAATHVPGVPPWATPVGQAYRLITSENAPELISTTLNFKYLENQVLPGDEPWLRLYRWDEAQAEWEQLPTRLDTDRNYAFAPIHEEGLYALMSSLEIPLYGPGWDTFSYPVQGTRPITQALQSIQGHFATVYGYDAHDTADPWKVYDVTGIPGWVNDLHDLAFGESYWISVTQPITLYLKGASDVALASAEGLQSPPATLYGRVLPGPGFAPTLGMTVTAWISDSLCGQGQTFAVGDKLVYTLNVFADGPGGRAGCGTPGQLVRFEVGAQAMVSTARWDNHRVRELTLSSDFCVYLPLMLKQ